MTKLKFRNYTDRLDRTYQIKNTGVLIPGIFVNRLRDKLNTQKNELPRPKGTRYQNSFNCEV